MSEQMNNPLLPWEEGYAEGGGWWSTHRTTPPASPAPLLEKEGKMNLQGVY